MENEKKLSIAALAGVTLAASMAMDSHSYQPREFHKVVISSPPTKAELKAKRKRQLQRKARKAGRK